MTELRIPYSTLCAVQRDLAKLDLADQLACSVRDRGIYLLDAYRNGMDQKAAARFLHSVGEAAANYRQRDESAAAEVVRKQGELIANAWAATAYATHAAAYLPEDEDDV